MRFEGKLFRTLTHRAVGPHGVEPQPYHGYLPLPNGCQVAPDQASIHSDVIAAHPWGTKLLVLASGKAYYTKPRLSGGYMSEGVVVIGVW